jgi:hypothetical protein
MLQDAGERDAILVDDVERGLTSEDYDEGYRAWRDHISGFDWCIDTGRFGSVGEPGISDLDCAAVIHDGHHQAAIDVHRAWLDLQSRERQFLFPHEPLFITEGARPLVPLLHTVRGLRWDGKPRIAMQGLPAEASLMAHLAYALAVAPECVRRIEHQGRLSLRLFLLFLKSLHASEEYWGGMAGDGGSRTAPPLTDSRRLRLAVLNRDIPDAQLTGIVLGEIKSSISRLCRHLDAFGAEIPGAENHASRGATEQFTRTYGRITAAQATKLDAREHETALHRNVFALAFGLLSRDTPLGRASASFWGATGRMRAIQEKERLREDWYFPRPFYYQPGVDDADLADQRFSCAALPSATAFQESGDARMSVGTAGHLVYGPYVRIQQDARYMATLSYLTTSCGGPIVGNLEIVASRLDEKGQQMGFTTLGQVQLSPTHGKTREASVEFDATSFAGRLLEVRVYVEEGVIMKAFHIRIRRRRAPDSAVRHLWSRLFARGVG